MYVVYMCEIIGLHVYGVGLVEVEPGGVKKSNYYFWEF